LRIDFLEFFVGHHGFSPLLLHQEEPRLHKERLFLRKGAGGTLAAYLVTELNRFFPISLRPRCQLDEVPFRLDLPFLAGCALLADLLPELSGPGVVLFAILGRGTTLASPGLRPLLPGGDSLQG